MSVGLVRAPSSGYNTFATEVPGSGFAFPTQRQRTHRSSAQGVGDNRLGISGMSPRSSIAHVEHRPSSGKMAAPSSLRTETGQTFGPHSSRHTASRQNPIHRVSTSSEPALPSSLSNRRSSAVFHEIQPPPRKGLSSHQLLLLTPFGDSVLGQSTDMSASASHMTRGVGRDPFLFHSSMKTRARANTGGSSRTGTSSPLRPPYRPLMRSGLPGASAPMSTIPSIAESNPSSENDRHSRDRAENTDRVEQGTSLASGPQRGAGRVETVAMARSNSHPVLTLRALEALKDRDGNLGIARGSNWAWISQEPGDDGLEDLGDPETLDSAGPVFSDPFALGAASSSATTGTLHPQTSAKTPEQAIKDLHSTSSDYHYSPSQINNRRVSETPVSGMQSHNIPPSRRPTVPTGVKTRLSTSSKASSTTASVASDGPSTGSATTADPSSSTEPSTPRRRLSRYRSLPSRSSGMGLSIVVRQTPMEDSPAEAEEMQLAMSRRSSEISNENSPNSIRRMSQSRYRGAWAMVDVMDTLASPSSPPVTPRKLSPNQHSHPSTIPRARTPLFVVEQVTNRSPSPFEMGPDGRRGFDSVDSGSSKPVRGARTLGGQVMMNVFGNDDWATFPRRGSLAMLSETALGPWALRRGSGKVDLQGHLSNRRASENQC